MNTKELSPICRQVRRDIITMTANAGSGHPGGSLSAVELMTSVFFNHMRVDPQNPHDPDRDRFVLSKGHAAPCYYAVLAAKGFISRDEYANFRQLHSILQGHPDAKKVPGIDASTGSLGQGVSIAVGMALGAKHLGKDTKVFALVGDGESQEGQIWEAYMAAAHYKLDNLTVIIDNNGLQIDGTNDQVMSLGDLPAKLRAFGFDLVELPDGNDLDAVEATMTANAGSGHPGGSLSAVELMTSVFFNHMRVDPKNPHDPDRDRFVLSKGHAAPCYYAVLAAKGFISRAEYANFRQLHSILQGHPDAKKVPGVDASTGSLGQGVSIAVGMALGAKHLGKDTKVFALVGDGESQEGQIWEAYMAAAHYKLDNLTVIIDNNGLQIDGTNDQVMSLGDLPAKLRAFGFDLVELPDGNDLDAVEAALSSLPASPRPSPTHRQEQGRFMENRVGWHGKAPNTGSSARQFEELEGLRTWLIKCNPSGLRQR